MWATDHAGIEADLVVAGKSLAAGLPLSAVIGRREVFERVPARAIGGTYVGNPVACAAALAVLDVIEKERLVERAAELGTSLRRSLGALAERYTIVGNVRGLGAMMAIELVRDRATKGPARQETLAVIAHVLANGVLVLQAGVYGNVIRFLVPLVISEEDLQTALAALDRALTAVTVRLSRSQEHSAQTDS
jgi:4-aminobutyrate aminotransferase/(S)-3-amino-2-methylpropionate transaminase